MTIVSLKLDRLLTCLLYRSHLLAWVCLDRAFIKYL